MSYFENFLKANQAYVELHGDLHLPIKPKTQVAIVTCMDSLSSRSASTWSCSRRCPYFTECWWARDGRYDPVPGPLSASNRWEPEKS